MSLWLITLFLQNSVIPKLTQGAWNTKSSCLFLWIFDLFTDTNFVLAGYKTEQCTKPPRLCRQGYACPHFHNSRDRRRNPRTFKYRYMNICSALFVSQTVVSGLVCLGSYAMGIPSGIKTSLSQWLCCLFVYLFIHLFIYCGGKKLICSEWSVTSEE